MLVGPLVLKTLSGTVSESDGGSLYALMHNLVGSFVVHVHVRMVLIQLVSTYLSTYWKER